MYSILCLYMTCVYKDDACTFMETVGVNMPRPMCGWPWYLLFPSPCLDRVSALYCCVVQGSWPSELCWPLFLSLPPSHHRNIGIIARVQGIQMPVFIPAHQVLYPPPQSHLYYFKWQIMTVWLICMWDATVWHMCIWWMNEANQQVHHTTIASSPKTWEAVCLEWQCVKKKMNIFPRVWK